MSSRSYAASRQEPFCKTTEQEFEGSEPLFTFRAKGVPQQQIRSASLESCTQAQIAPTDSRAELFLTFANDLSKVSYKLRIENGRRLTQGHLHVGTAGMNGPPVAFLFRFSDFLDSDGEDFSGCIEGEWHNEDLIGSNQPQECGGNIPITIAHLFHLVRHDSTYFNIHSEGQPAGMIRGQVWNPNQ